MYDKHNKVLEEHMAFSIIFTSLLACIGSQNNGFSSLGQTSLDPDSMMNQGGGGEDTANPEDVENPNAPIITEAIAFFSEVTGVGESGTSSSASSPDT